ncbi:MAG: hypothetical protein QXN77_08050 [Candidatus Caldarchaeum sp.]
MANLYVTAPTTVTVDWGKTGDKTLLQITDNLPSGNKVVIFALGWDSASEVGAQGYLKIVSGGTTLVQEGITHYLNFGGMRAKHSMLFAYHANAPANAQYTFIATVTTAATGSNTLHVQGMVILLTSSAFFTTGSNTNIAAGATVTLATVTTNFPAGSKVVVLAYVQMGVTSTSGGHRVYAAGNIRILKGSSIVSQNQFQVGTYRATEPAMVSLSFLDSSAGANQDYTIQVYNNLSETSQAWGEIIAFIVGGGAFLDTASVGLTNGSQVTVGNLSTSLGGEVGVIALAAAENTGTTDVTAFNAGDVVLQLNDQTTGQVANQRNWLLERTSYNGRSGVYGFFRADTDVSSPSYQVKMTARVSGINGEAKILAFTFGVDIKKWLAETLQVQEGVARVVGKFKSVSESLNLQEGVLRIMGKFRSVGESVNISEAFSRARQMVRKVGETINLTEAIVRARSLARKIGENLNISESVVRTVKKFRSLAETVNISEASKSLRERFRTIGETLNISEAFSRFRSRFRRIDETLNLMEVVSKARVLSRRIAETVNISEVIRQVKGKSLFFTEQLNIMEASRQLRNRFRTVGETVQLSESARRARALVRRVGEQINISEIGKSLRGLARWIGETLQVSEAVARMRSRFRMVSEQLNISEASKVVRAMVRQIAEQVRITESAFIQRALARVVSESIRILENIRSKAIRILARLVGAFGKVRGASSLGKVKGEGERA